jgi:hypothetical protein
MSASRVLAAAVLAAPLVAAVQQIPKSQPQQAFPESSQRGSTRIFYWGGDRSGGQVMVDFGQPAWKEEYDAKLDELLGVRWRLGQNFWTRLESNMDLTAGDADVPAGLYYLVLERRKEDKSFVLWLLDPVEIRDAKLDAFQAEKTSGGIGVPMAHESGDVRADRLVITLAPDARRKDGATLQIHFGKHRLTAGLTLHPTRD